MSGTVAHVVGARPNFMKAAPVIRALERRGVAQSVIHSGQHYDAAMSDVFFRDLGLPEPDRNLGVGSGSHAVQTAAIMVALEQAFGELRPALAIVYGDVNSTTAAALVAAKIGLPLAHVEAGLRSFDMTMPEEVNRRVTDILSDLCFVTSPEAIAHLAHEGVPPDRIHLVGNPMIDTLLANLDRFDPERQRVGARPGRTVRGRHAPPAGQRGRPGVGPPARRDAGRRRGPAPGRAPAPPARPRLAGCAGLGELAGVRIVEPLGYLDFMSLVRGATVVVTDSGGIQEETTILGVPCLTVRPNTERPITITHGTNRLVTPDEAPAAVAGILAGAFVRPAEPPPLWDGQAGERIAGVIVAWLAAR